MPLPSGISRPPYAWGDFKITPKNICFSPLDHQVKTNALIRDDFIAAGFLDTFYASLVEIASDEKTHVEFLTTTLGSAAVAAVTACNYSFPSTNTRPIRRPSLRPRRRRRERLRESPLVQSISQSLHLFLSISSTSTPTPARRRRLHPLQTLPHRHRLRLRNLAE